jgi:hypothetical protein
VAVPARPINANLRRRTDDRLAEEINADLASVAAPAGDQAAGRHDARMGATTVVLLHDADPRPIESMPGLGKPVEFEHGAASTTT